MLFFDEAYKPWSRLNKIIAGIIFIVFLFPELYNTSLEKLLTYDGYKYSFFGLVAIFTIIIIYKFLVVARLPKGNLYVNLIVSIVFGFLSSTLIGDQTHDEHEGAMSAFGPPVWLFYLGWFFPILFFLFIYFLGRVNNKILSVICLTLWNIVVTWIGYFYHKPAFEKLGQDYDGYFFPSESKMITPILLVVVGVMTLVVLMKDNVYKNKTLKALN